jgi:hypothetical protein
VETLRCHVVGLAVGEIEDAVILSAYAVGFAKEVGIADFALWVMESHYLKCHAVEDADKG